jgi:hypothetical protein
MLKALGILLIASFLACLTTISVVKGYRHWRAPTTDYVGKLGICIIAIGGVGLLEPFWIGLFHEVFDHFELPNTIDATRLIAPDGRVFIVSSPVQRVQRYGPEGFEKGFSIGRVSFAAISASGNVVTCSPGHEMRTYSPDGDELPPRRTCREGFKGGSSFSAVNAKVPAIAFNWFSALAVPLWHPFLAMLIMMLGVALLKDSTPAKQEIA